MKHRFSLLAAGTTPYGGSYFHICAITINGMQGALLEVGFSVNKHSPAPPRFYCDILWWQLIWFKMWWSLRKRSRARAGARV